MLGVHVEEWLQFQAEHALHRVALNEVRMVLLHLLAVRNRAQDVLAGGSMHEHGGDGSDQPGPQEVVVHSRRHPRRLRQHLLRHLRLRLLICNQLLVAPPYSLPLRKLLLVLLMPLLRLLRPQHLLLLRLRRLVTRVWSES
jgi:hypothetical protein